MTTHSVTRTNVALPDSGYDGFAVVKGQLPKKTRLITPDFKVETAKGLVFQSFTAKVARGTLARWLCEERIDDLAALPRFDRDGWAYDAEGSTAARPLFIKG